MSAATSPLPSGACPECGSTTSRPFCTRDGVVLRPFELGGRYAISQRIGVGGMAFVFAARHLGLGRDVAVKLLRPERAHQADEVQRFLREARTACELAHPNIATIYDVGHDDALDLTYLAMERVHGVTLAELLRRDGAMPWRRAVAILVQIARAAGAAHDLGVIHRDLSPRNVMLTSTSRAADVVKLCDFGLSRRASGSDRITATGAFLGTPAYMAPEQIDGAPAVDHRVDIYAIGAIGYELLSGALPITATSAGALIAAKLNADARPLRERWPELRVPLALDTLLTSALSRDPASRPADAAVFERALLGVLGAEPDADASGSLIGRTVGSYVIRELLGAGGTGSVYLAHHPVIGLDVAVKVLLPEVASNAELVDRFVREARGANSIGSPHIPRYFDFGRLPDGRSYAVMEHLAGETVAERLEREGALPLADAIALLDQVASAMGRAHAAGIIHRDLKPENLFLTRDADGAMLVKVLDFGIAKLLDAPTGGATTTRVGYFMGTPLYCAPEQAYAGEVTTATDVYALGIIAFEVLAGGSPFTGEITEILAAKLRGQLPSLRALRPDLPDAVAADIAAMCEPNPTLRLGTMADVRARIASWSREAAAAAPHPRAPTAPPTTTPTSSWPVELDHLATISAPPAASPVGARPVTLPAIAERYEPVPDLPPSTGRRGRIVAIAAACLALVVLGGWLALGRDHAARRPTAATKPIEPGPVVRELVVDVDAGVAAAQAVDGGIAADARPMDVDLSTPPAPADTPPSVRAAPKQRPRPPRGKSAKPPAAPSDGVIIADPFE